MLTYLLVSGVLPGCAVAPDHDGIAIGNPPNMDARLAPAESAQVTQARMAVSDVSAGCGADVASLSGVQEVDLLGENQIPLPATSFCVLAIGTSSPLQLAFTTASGANLEASLDVGTLSLMASQPVESGTALVLELGAPGWLNGAAIPEGTTSITPGSDLHGLLVAALRSGSAVYPDVNGDGWLGADERALGSILTAGTTDATSNTGLGADPGAPNPSASTAGDTGDTGECAGAGCEDGNDDEREGADGDGDGRRGREDTAGG